MDEWVKVYEEIVMEDVANFENYRIWLNDILEDESIVYRMETVRDNETILPGVFSNMLVEFYVYESDVLRVKELIDIFQSSSFSSEHDELNVTEEDLNYEDEW